MEITVIDTYAPPSWETPEDQVHELRSALGDQRYETDRLRTAIADALIPLLRAYADLPCAPEAFRATVERATGFNGGNHTHGGVLRISFATGQGDNDVSWKNDPTATSGRRS